MQRKPVRCLALILTLALLALTACSAAGEPGSGTPSPSEPASPPPSAADAEATLPTEGNGSFKAFADELNTAYRAELSGALNQWLYALRNGSFEEMPNHHPPYPSDFPPASNLPVAEQNLTNIFILWREEVRQSENTGYEGGVSVVVPIDESHLYILEPAKFTDSDGHTTIGFGSSGFFAMTMEDFLAQSAEHAWNQVPHDEPDDTLSAVFALGAGLQGEKSLRIGDRIGEWTLADLQIDYDGDRLTMLEALFEGDVVLSGVLSRDVLSGEGFDFTVSEADTAKMPYYISPEMPAPDEKPFAFMLNFADGAPEAPSLEYGEEISCKITVRDYRFIFAYMMAPPHATVIDLELL